MHVFSVTRTAFAVYASLVAVGSTGCKSTGDPREDGFLGGVSGLATGSYRQEVEERRNKLEQEQAVRDELEERYSEKERETNQTAKQLSRTRAEIERMDSELDRN